MSSSSSSARSSTSGRSLLDETLLGVEEIVKCSKETLSARYEEEMEQIEEWRHEELRRRDAVLQRTRQKRMRDADDFRKAQIRNISEMYEWEKKEAEARYKQQLTETKERLVVELSAEVVRQNRIIDEHFAARSNMRSLNSIPATATTSIDNAHHIMEDASSRYTGGGRQPKRARQVSTSAGALDKALPEDEIRRDFVTIVRDLESRNSRNGTATKGSSEGGSAVLVAVPVSVDTAEQHIKVGPVPGTNVKTDGALAKEIVYPLGALVLLKSAVSAEEFSGVITAISTHEIIVKLGHNNTRLRVYLNQIRDRRVWICPDRDLESDAGLIRSAKLSMQKAADWGSVAVQGTDDGAPLTGIAARPMPTVTTET
jgi:hypothetical protein